jgi:hypothetical protein
MKEAGFNAVFLGIENPDEEALRRMNKKQNLKVDIPGAVEAIQAEGIEVYAGFIFGSDSDEPTTVDRIVDFVKRTRVFTAMTGMLTPIPHTPLWERLRRDGRLNPAEFSGNNTDDDVQFVPLRMTAEEMHQGIHDILSRLFSASESYRRAMDMLRSVQPHIFNGSRFQPRYMWSAVVSFWKLGVRRLDPAYFRLLWGARCLDRQRLRENRREVRDLKRLARGLKREGGLRGSDRGWMEELAGYAEDYLVRFRPDERLEQVRAWVSDVRTRVRLGSLSAEDARAVCEHARRYLKYQMRRNRFPGIALERAIEAAIKSLHYQMVMRAVVGGGRRG